MKSLSTSAIFTALLIALTSTAHAGNPNKGDVEQDAAQDTPIQQEQVGAVEQSTDTAKEASTEQATQAEEAPVVEQAAEIKPEAAAVEQQAEVEVAVDDAKQTAEIATDAAK